MATSTIAGRVHELGVKLEPPSEVEINVPEDVNSSVENDNGRRRLLKCFAGSSAGDAATADGPNASSATEASPSVKLGVVGELCQESKSKTDKIREAVEQVTSEESKKKISKLLADIQQLPDVEKLLLYLRLPSGSKVEVDPLKQSFVSSLGNRYEVTQTITWIQTHLEEDSDVSLPKQEVYDGYCEFCTRVCMKPLSTADFGKVMKQVFPNVRPRRLGTRGNSRYCYAGLRKKVKLEAPRLPDLSFTHEESLEEAESEEQELNGAISFLICDWAEKLLERKFTTLRELANHVVEKGYVAGHSVATFTMLCAPSGQIGKNGQPHHPLISPCDGSKHRETRIQLQRKLHERESIREQKKRLVEQKNQGEKSYPVVNFLTAPASNLSKLNNRKNQNGKSVQPDTLRKLLSNASGESSTSEDLKKQLGEALFSTCEDTPKLLPKLEKKESTELGWEKASNAPSNKLSTLHKRRGSATLKSSGDHSSFSSETIPVRRRSGGGGDSRSPKPSSLVSGWGTPVTDVIKSRMTPNSENVSSVSTCNKSGKVLIPRVTTRSNSSGPGSGNNQGSKLCFPQTNIIIFPTGVPISTEFSGNTGCGGGGGNGGSANNNGSNGIGGQKPKYKKIQPKPCTLSNWSEVKNVSEPNIEKDEKFAKTTRRGSNSKKNSDDKDDNESLKMTKTSRKRSKHLSEPDKTKSKRVCIQMQRSSVDEMKIFPKSEDTNEGSQGEMNINTLEQEALLDYLNPSVEQEDELVRYFGHGDDNLPESGDIKNEMCDLELANGQSDAVSRLRQLLQQNLLPNQSDGSDPNLRRDAANMNWAPSINPNLKDNTPTLRLLLCEQRQGSFSDVQNVMNANDQSGMMDNCNTNINSGLSSGSQMVDVCSSTVQDDSWRHGSNSDFMCSAAGNSDEILMSSDSSSGCYPPISNNSFLSLDESILAHENSLNQRQMMDSNGSHCNSALTYGGHLVSYQLQSNGSSSVPPSPNTRRRAFNFQPISPQSTPVQETHSCTQSPLPYYGPMSNVRTQYGAGPPSATSSPFVSPRSTPSSLCRSRHNSGQAINTASSSAIGTPRATPHTGTDQSSCQASPFISPHPTPVPFSRSRHNSSQQLQQQRFTSSSSNLTTTLTSSRSRHPSDLMLGPLLSPNSGGGVNSAPMSPLEPQQQSLSSSSHFCDINTENQYQSNNRSRHNSSSNFVSLPPPPPPQPLQTNITSLLAPPPPPLKITSDPVDNNLVQSWSTTDAQTNDWLNKQVDPRTLSRHRHASVGSHFPQQTTNIGTSFLSELNASSSTSISSQDKADFHGVVNRSQSVPLYQMLDNMHQNSEATDVPIRDVIMPHSYPATPTGQATTFFGDIEVHHRDENELNLQLHDYPTINETDDIELAGGEQCLKNQPYRQQEPEIEVSVNDGNNLSTTLDLPMDQYQNIIPSCHLDEYMLPVFSQVEMDLEQCFRNGNSQ